MGRVRLQDVADISGVSIATASIVLSGNRDRRISTSTCGRVRAAAESLGYTGRPPVAPLRGLGVLLDVDGDSASGALMIEAIQNAACSIGDPPVLSAHVQRHGATQFACKSLLRRGADSLIFVSKSFQSLSDLHGVPWRAAFINCVPATGVATPGSWAVVLPDHRHLAEGVAERLIRQGHVRLLAVSAEPDSAVALEWVAGMQAEAATWAPAARVDVVTARAAADLSAAVVAALAGPPEVRPTAVVALEEGGLAAVLEAGSRLGLAIPDDLLVVTRSAEHRPATGLATTSLSPSAADLAGVAVEALASAGQWRTGDGRPRVIRVRPRSDLWRREQLAAPRSA